MNLYIVVIQVGFQIRRRLFIGAATFRRACGFDHIHCKALSLVGFKQDFYGRPAIQIIYSNPVILWLWYGVMSRYSKFSTKVG
jgi:hypothetical protein